MRWNKKTRGLFIAIAVLGLLLAGGCAATNGSLSQEKIFRGNKSIGEAKQSNAGQNAPEELKKAEDKLAEAEAAFTAKEYEKAARLAEQASADADYARAKAKTEKAKKTAEEMHQAVQVLRQELERMPQ